MKVVRTFERIFSNKRKCGLEKKLSQRILTLMTILLRISPGLGDDRFVNCKIQDPALCSSLCTYFKDKCNGNRECTIDLCSYLYPRLPPVVLERCWELHSDCTDELRYPSKRGILNKNVAYLLLKLHPFINQTSQFGFLTSGRFRRITGSFGTEFLGKRSNNKPTGRGTSTTSKPPPKFYSLPLDKFSKSKIVKKDEEFSDFKVKRLSVRGNGRVITGSEFLGKRDSDRNERFRRLLGTELLGKRNGNPFDGTEFLGKRQLDLDGALGKKERDPVTGTELLGKRLIEREYESRRDPGFGFWFDYDPGLIDEVFSRYATFQNPRTPLGSYNCRESESVFCTNYKNN